MERGLDGSAVLDVGGVGYEVFVPLGTLGKLAVAPETITLHIHTHVREDALILYGFASVEDRAAFRTLLGVSSVGPKLALSILSQLDARALAAAVASEDRTRFKGISGVGKKIVDRLVLELKDKLGFVSAGAAPPISSATRSPSNNAPLAQVASALVSMGWKPSEADRAVAAIGADAEGKSVDALLREALATLSF